MKKQFFFIFSLLNFAVLYSENLHTIFLPGIVATPLQMQQYIDAQAIITPATCVLFDDMHPAQGYGINQLIYQISHYYQKPVNRACMYLGQTGDILQAKNTCEEQISPYILYGLSRGGKVALHVASCNENLLQALIIESAPYQISQSLYEWKCYLGIPFNPQTLLSWVFPGYDPLEPENNAMVSKMPDKNLPILIIHSKEDSRVNFLESVRYYVDLKNQGFSHVYLLCLETGKHGYLFDQIDTPSALLYLQTLHSFYKLYNLPYLEEYAYFNQEMLQRVFQPDIATLQEMVHTYDENLKSTYEQRKLINKALICISALVGLYIFIKNSN